MSKNQINKSCAQKCKFNSEDKQLANFDLFSTIVKFEYLNLKSSQASDKKQESTTKVA